MQIVHLKRFQFHNGRWVKSHKIVNFPKKEFDPSCYVVPRLKTTDHYVDDNDDDIGLYIVIYSESIMICVYISCMHHFYVFPTLLFAIDIW